jgi:uncharacterized membrane protein (DUF485 family)
LALAEHVISPVSLSEGDVGRHIPTTVTRIEEVRRRLVRPLLFFSSAFYVVGLLVLAYLPDVSAFKITGSVNAAYVLALAQFVMTFVVAYVYAGRANRQIDPLVAEAFAELSATRGTGVTP